MKTIPFLLVFLGSLFCRAQYSSVDNFPKAILKVEFQQKKLNSQRAKVVGDTLYYQDFSGGIPLGWTVVNNTNNLNNWIWSNSAPGGQYTVGTTPINSTSGTNGFMSLPADFYNTPFPANGPDSIDAWFASPAILINPKQSVQIKWEQSQRYCCDQFSELVLEVSNDSIIWVSYDATNGRGVNTAFPFPTNNPAEEIILDISPVVANSDTIYLRFRMTGATHYYWMIDDLLISEGPSRDLIIEKFDLDMNPGFPIKPYYSRLPQKFLPPLQGRIYSLNNGPVAYNQLTAELKFVQDSTLYGQLGWGIAYLRTINKTIPTPPLGQDTFVFNHYNNTGSGYYRAIAGVSGSMPLSLPDSKKISFVVTDTVFARDLNEFNVNAGPFQFQGGGNNGDKWGVLYNLGSSPNSSGGGAFNSINYFISDDSANIGASFQPRIWWYDHQKSTLDSAITYPPVGNSPFTTVITANDLGSWISIPLFPPANLCSGYSYVVGYEQINGAINNKRVVLGRDTAAERYSVPHSNFVFINDTNPSWRWTDFLAGIRLNSGIYGGGCSVGTAELALTNHLEVYPNPSSGQFVIYLKLNRISQYTLRIRNILGQVIFKEQVLVGDNFAKDIDLSDQTTGIYFVSLENGKERIVEKVIVQ